MEILNPINNYTYEFIESLIKEVKEVFSDPFIHLGMDEVYYSCWESNPDIKEWMMQNNFSLTKDVEQYYMGKILNIANNIGYKVTVWQDVWDNKVKVNKKYYQRFNQLLIINFLKVFNDTVIQIWKDYVDRPWQEYLKNATGDGYKVILSSPWYLNYIKYGIDWYVLKNTQ